MRRLVIAVLVAAGASFVGTLGASAAPASGQAIRKAPNRRAALLRFGVVAAAAGIVTVGDVASPDARKKLG